MESVKITKEDGFIWKVLTENEAIKCWENHWWLFVV